MTHEVTHVDLLERVQQLTPVIQEHADRAEQERHLATPLVAALHPCAAVGECATEILPQDLRRVLVAARVGVKLVEELHVLAGRLDALDIEPVLVEIGPLPGRAARRAGRVRAGFGLPVHGVLSAVSRSPQYRGSSRFRKPSAPSCPLDPLLRLNWRVAHD